MIPILLLAGLAIGLLPRWWRIAAVVAVGVVSVLLFERDDLITQPVDAAGVFVLAVVNTGAGAFFGWLIRRLVTTRPNA